MKISRNKVTVIGAGLSGCEASYQLLKRGFAVDLYEMRPLKSTPAHKTGDFAELVCSNSLKSDVADTSSGLLKTELKMLDSLLLKCAYETSVEAGGALAVDRKLFSESVRKNLEKYERFNLITEEVERIPAAPVIVATGPLTGEKLFDDIKSRTSDRLFFFDAVAPIVDASSVDPEKSFESGRYGKGDGYINCPMNKEEYDAFYNALVNGETVPLKDFEGKEVFEGCMPVEVMAKRGYDTMRFGMLKPVGLTDPKTGRRPYAVLQLRKETQDGSAYNLVGFQTNLKFSEQKRIFSMIPALNHAEFLRYGVMHRNSYLYSPDCLTRTFRLKGDDAVYFGGQITGVEGYVESIMSGLLAAIHLSREIDGLPELVPPKTTMCGALSRYITLHNKNFQPMNSNFGILPAVEGRDKNERRTNYVARAVSDMENYVNALNRDEELSR